MKKLLFSGILTCLLCIPAVWAEGYTFTYTSTEGMLSGNGQLTAVSNNNGSFTATGGTFVVTSTTLPDIPLGLFTLVQNPNAPNSTSFRYSPDGTDLIFDNQLFPGNTSQYLDGDGLGFSLDPMVLAGGKTDQPAIAIWGNGNLSYTGFAEPGYNATTGQLTLTPTPEPGFAGVLLLGMGGLLPLAFRRRKA